MFSILIIIFIFHISKLCHGYLNSLQIGYIKNILSNPTTPTDIRRKTQQILFMEYMPWLKKQVRLFKQTNEKSLKFILEYDLQQYAIIV